MKRGVGSLVNSLREIRLRSAYLSIPVSRCALGFFVRMMESASAISTLNCPIGTAQLASQWNDYMTENHARLHIDTPEISDSVIAGHRLVIIVSL